jgi:hypothetical protein
MKVRVVEGRSVAVDGKVHLGGEEFSVPEEHRKEAEMWLRLGYVEEAKPKRRTSRRGGRKAEEAREDGQEKR